MYREAGPRAVDTLVSRKYAPHFATLGRGRGGGLYAGCDNFYRDYALPSAVTGNLIARKYYRGVRIS